MSDSASVVRSVGVVLAGRAAVLGGGLATSIVIARALGAEGRGEYFTIVTTAALLAQAANFGLSSSNTVVAARDPAAIPVLVGNSAWLAGAVALLSALLLAAFGDELAKLLDVGAGELMFVALLGPAILLFTLLASVVAAQQQFGALSTWQLSSTLLSVGLALACAALSVGPAGFLAASTLAAGVVAGLLYLRLPRPSAESVVRRAAVARSGMGYSLRAYFALLFAFVLQRAGVYAVGMHRDAGEVGVYSVALQVYDVLAMLPGAAALVLLPRIAGSSGSGWLDTKRMLIAVGGLLVAVATAFTIVAEPVVVFAFGREFAHSGSVVKALMPGAVAVGFTAVLSQFLVSREFPLLLVAVWFVGMCTTGALAARWAAVDGAVGAAWAHSVGAIVVLLGCAALAWVRVRADGGVESASKG